MSRSEIFLICTFAFCQDFNEMLFRKIRSLGGFNDNPTQEQFIAAFRKISVNRNIQILKNGNCMPSNDETKPFSNILFVTSRKERKDRHDSHEIPRNSDLNMLLNEVTQLEESSNDRNVSYISHIIENKFIKADRKICSICRENLQRKRKMSAVSRMSLCRNIHNL